MREPKECCEEFAGYCPECALEINPTAEELFDIDDDERES